MQRLAAAVILACGLSAGAVHAEGDAFVCMEESQEKCDYENQNMELFIKAREAFDRGYAYCGRVDADGQHPVDELRRLLELVRSDVCDVAVGSRFAAGEGYDEERYEPSPARRFGIGLLQKAMHLRLGRPFHDPTSGMVAVMEEARAFGELLRQGWKPKRTIIFCAWDAEEQGLIGSTEWAETHADDLKQKAVLYLNSDSNGKGQMGAGGSHSLERLVNEVAADIDQPGKRVSVLEAALEFGASISIDLGVASGGVHVLAGIYYCWQDADQRGDHQRHRNPPRGGRGDVQRDPEPAPGGDDGFGD